VNQGRNHVTIAVSCKDSIVKDEIVKRLSCYDCRVLSGFESREQKLADCRVSYSQKSQGRDLVMIVVSRTY
jgi:hypothetical protein